jgi:hypothetical protein
MESRQNEAPDQEAQRRIALEDHAGAVRIMAGKVQEPPEQGAEQRRHSVLRILRDATCPPGIDRQQADDWVRIIGALPFLSPVTTRIFAATMQRMAGPNPATQERVGDTVLAIDPGDNLVVRP